MLSHELVFCLHVGETKPCKRFNRQLRHEPLCGGRLLSHELVLCLRDPRFGLRGSQRACQAGALLLRVSPQESPSSSQPPEFKKTWRKRRWMKSCSQDLSRKSSSCHCSFWGLPLGQRFGRCLRYRSRNGLCGIMAWAAGQPRQARYHKHTRCL